jgi:nucleoside-diphosphate-sugar epimerase
MRATSPSEVLLTGGAGVLGQALLDELDGGRVTCLTHRKPIEGRRVRSVSADLSRQRLGLGERAWRELAARTDVVVHCAARTGFGRGPAAAEAVNVDGTARMLELADAAGAPLYYVGSAFESRIGLRSSQSHADESPIAAGVDAYLRSKRRAERLVDRSGVPASVFKPALIVGHSRTGWMARFQGIHLVASLVVRDLAPLMPVPGEAQIDFLPQDVVARAIVASVDAGEVGRELWLTAGDDAMPLERVIRMTADFAGRIGRPVEPCRFVEPDILDRLIRPVFFAELPSEVRDSYEQMITLMSLFYTTEPFPTSLDELVAEGKLADPPVDLEDAYERNLWHWAERTGMLERAAA